MRGGAASEATRPTKAAKDNRPRGLFEFQRKHATLAAAARYPSMRNPLLEPTQKGRYALPMAVIVNWNGVDVPEELKALEKGRYVLVPIDEPPELTEEQEAGLEDAMASIRAGEGLSLEEALAQAKARLE